MLNFKIIVLVSANGSGKGTFGRYISGIDSSYVNIDAGVILRQEIRSQTEFGKKVKKIYEACAYLDGSIDEIIWQELILDLINKAFFENKKIILDGCFRSKETFAILDRFLRENNLIKDTCLLQLIASDKVCTERILSRRICAFCGELDDSILEKYFDESCKYGKNCKKCGQILETRISDNPEFTKERLLYFHEKVEPIISEAKKKYNFIQIDTECNIECLYKKYREIFLDEKIF